MAADPNTKFSSTLIDDSGQPLTKGYTPTEMMMTAKRRPVLSLSGRDFADLMAEATYLGVKDASSPPVPVKTADEVILALGLCDLRKAHTKFLKSAYMAGRFQIDTMGMD